MGQGQGQEQRQVRVEEEVDIFLILCYISWIQYYLLCRLLPRCKIPQKKSNPTKTNAPFTPIMLQNTDGVGYEFSSRSG